LDVNANITNSTVKVEITNASIDVGTVSGTVNIAGNVGITAGQVVNVKNATGSSLTVAGSVNATIQNAQIDTNVVNAQIQDSLNYSAYYQFSFVSSATEQSQTSPLIQLVPNGQSLSCAVIQGWFHSPNNETYQNIQINLYQTFADGTQQEITNANAVTYDLTSNPFWIEIATEYFSGQPALFNAITITVNTETTGLSTADSPTVYLVFHGQTTPDLTSVDFPGYSVPSFTMPGSATQTAMSNGVPLPVQLYEWDTSASEYVQMTRKKVWLSVGTIGENDTINWTSATTTKIYRVYLSAWPTTGGGLLRLATTGGNWLAHIAVATTNVQNTVSWESSRGVPVSGNLQLYNEYGSSGETIYFNVMVEYE